jgi:hypothetical protein
MIDGMVNNVLYVPSLSTNFLSIHHITNSSSWKTILLTLDSIVVCEIEDPLQIVVIGKMDHHALLYSFSHFVLESPTNVLLAHSNGLSKLWYERFGH